MFSITVLPAVGGHRWIEVVGTVDASAAPDVRQLALTAVALPSTRSVTLDLRRARLAGDAAVAGLAEVAAAAARAGKPLVRLDAQDTHGPRTPNARAATATPEAGRRRRLAAAA